ncbi:unnamed protein product, partial [Rotaria sp. Silwood2]
KHQLLIMSNSEQVNIASTHTTIDVNKNDKTFTEPTTFALGHDLHDQRLDQNEQKQQSSIDFALNSIQKFDGSGDPEFWLKHFMEKFDSLQLKRREQYKLIPDTLTGEALIWYGKQQDHMPTFITFMKKFLQHFDNQELKTDLSTKIISPGTPSKQSGNANYQDAFMDCLRTQMLITSLEKLPKFSGKSKENVSNLLQEIQQTMNIFKLTDDEKLFYVLLCLEDYAQDWFYDNKHLMLTWTIFTQKLLKTFGSSGKAVIAFNRLRHYEQGITQDVKQYYFQIMKLCKEANPFMDDASKLQYLKDGLKPSLRFNVLLKNR